MLVNIKCCVGIRARDKNRSVLEGVWCGVSGASFTGAVILDSTDHEYRYEIIGQSIDLFALIVGREHI